MCHAWNEKCQTPHDRKSQTTKSSGIQNARRKRKLQIFGHIGSFHHQTTGNEEKVLKEYLRSRLITATRNNTYNKRTSGTTITRKQKWEEKQHYGHFKRQTNDISYEKTRTWLRKGKLKKETESLLIVTQNNAIKTNHIKARIDKTQ